MERQKRKWLVATTLALLFHGCLAIVLYVLAPPAAPTQKQSERLSVEIRQPAIEQKRPEEDSSLPVVEQKKKQDNSGLPALEQTREQDEGGLPALEQKREQDEGGLPALRPLDQRSLRRVNDVKDKPLNLTLKPSVAFEIAGDDIRIQQMIARRQKPRPFDRPRFTRRNVPQESGYEEIQRQIHASWEPQWESVKDESISKVSGKWVKKEFLKWALGWKKRMSDQGVKADTLPDEVVNAYHQRADLAVTSNVISIDLDFEPLRDGSWAVSVAKESDHPFFDIEAIKEAKKVAKLFPEWKEGYGRALRYRMTARFTIVPPNPSAILATSCVFCTPDELKNFKVIHWFKKMKSKDVRFMGISRPDTEHK